MRFLLITTLTLLVVVAISRPVCASQTTKALPIGVSILGIDERAETLLIQVKNKILSYSIPTNRFHSIEISSGWLPVKSNWHNPPSVGYIVISSGRNFKLLKVSNKTSLISLDFRSSSRDGKVKYGFYNRRSILSFDKFYVVFDRGRSVRIRKSQELGKDQSVDVLGQKVLVTRSQGIELFDIRTGVSLFKKNIKRNLLSGRMLDNRFGWLYDDQNSIYMLDSKKNTYELLWSKKGSWVHSFSPFGIHSIWHINVPDAREVTRGVLVVTDSLRGREVFRLQPKIGMIQNAILFRYKLIILCLKYNTLSPELITIDIPKPALTKP